MNTNDRLAQGEVVHGVCGGRDRFATSGHAVVEVEELLLEAFLV
jgi:hypothetical protein